MNENAKLSEEKLVECFKSLNVPVRMSDLKTPTSDFVVKTFDIFLKDLQINIASPLLQSFESIRHLENPEIYEEPRFMIILPSVMTQLLSHISPITITINDLIAPKPKRTKKIFNYLVILWNNYLRKSDLFQKTEEALRAEIQKFEDQRRETDDLKAKYKKKNVTIMQGIQFSSEELNNCLAVKEKQEKELEKNREELIDQYNQLKEKETNTMTEIGNTDIAIVTHREKLNELDQLIISSPEKISADILKLKGKVKEIEDRIREKELERKMKKHDCEYLEKAQELLVKNCSKQHKILTDIELLIENERCLCTLKDKCQEENKILKELESSQEMKEAMASIYDQKAFKIQLSKKNQIEEISETHQMLQKQLSEENYQLEKSISSIALLKEKINKEVPAVLEVVKKMNEAKANTNKVKSLYKAQLLQIEDNFKSDYKSVVEKAKQVFDV